jgi:UDP-glucose 4-epimerase
MTVLKNRNILVTGGCGYIGGHVTRQLSEAGANVTVIDNLSTGFSDTLIHGERLIESDISDMEVLNKTFSEQKFDAIIHFAASLIVEESVSDPFKYYDNNVRKSLGLIQSASQHGVKNIVFSSTAAVYGEKAKSPTSEDFHCEPANPYGSSKYMIEQIIKDFHKAHGLEHLILRYFNVAGSDSKMRMGLRSPNATHLIKIACEAATNKRDKITVFGDDYETPDGTCVRDYIHVEDLASAHLSSLRYLLSGGKSTTLNCGYGKGYSVKEVLDTFQEANDITLKIEQGPRRAGDVKELVADIRKISKTLDWVPKYDNLETIVKDAYNWELHLKSL